MTAGATDGSSGARTAAQRGPQSPATESSAGARTAAQRGPQSRTTESSATASASQLHSQALAEAAHGRYAAAHRLLHRALRRNPDPVRRAHIMLSLAFHEAERHSVAAGIALLDDARAVPGIPVRLRGLIASQRGYLYQRAGDAGSALAGFDEALRLLDETVPEDVCRALLNRGLLHLQHRRLARARADFSRCAGIAAGYQLEVLAAKAAHNLGYLSLLAGDLPRALREMDTVAAALGSLSPSMAAVCFMDRAQVLLSAGLLREADEDLQRAVELLRAGGLTQDQAEAELTRSQVAVLEERWSDARRLARQARRRFVGRGADTWALLAEQVDVTATVGSGRRLVAAAGQAARLAGELVAAGLDDEARRAALTAATALLARGDANGARAAAGSGLVLRRDDPITTRLQARSVRAGLADSTGRPRRADAELRAALHDLHRYQSSFGSLDLQTSVSTHGRRLAERGVARALAAGGPAAVFDWAERARALSSRLPPVVPPADPEAAGLLERLRHARAELREQRLARQVDPRLRAECATLERLIRQRSWYVAGPGQVSSTAPLRRLQEQLAVDGATFAAHLLAGGQLYALVVDGRRRLLRTLGPAGPVVELHRRLRADLDVLAGRALPAPMRATVHRASTSALAKLDELLWSPVRAELGEGPLLLAPAAALATVAWTLLPSLLRRPATVVGSATAWLAGRGRAPLPAVPTVALAVGPRVPRGVDEVRLIAAEWSTTSPPGGPDTPASVLEGGGATAAAVREAALRADVLHVAAHGVHEPDNPLFSHLELADGPLFGYELDQLPRLPTHIALSACELGLAGTRPGDETLGMTAALLHGGAGSVVAGIARIADGVACRVGAAHHAGLRRGLSPAAALAEAIADSVADGDDPAPLVCFGSGW